MTSEFVGKVRKIGSSLAIVIPKEVAKKEGIREGALVKVQIMKRDVSSFGASSGIGPWKGHDDDWGHDEPSND